MKSCHFSNFLTRSGRTQKSLEKNFSSSWHLHVFFPCTSFGHEELLLCFRNKYESILWKNELDFGQQLETTLFFSRSSTVKWMFNITGKKDYKCCFLFCVSLRISMNLGKNIKYARTSIFLILKKSV